MRRNKNYYYPFANDGNNYHKHYFFVAERFNKFTRLNSLSSLAVIHNKITDLSAISSFDVLLPSYLTQNAFRKTQKSEIFYRSKRKLMG
ncbi:unnamed protein product [Heterobilharzia americana]|nr:unnamed protein product [Heterobilharzia americana]